MIDFAELARPLSDASPCGPDLELADDPAYMQFMARAESLLPAAFVSLDPNIPDYFSFDRGSLEPEFRTIEKFLAETRDLRLFTLLAKLLLLNRDLAGFAGCCGSIATLLSALWDNVHPQVADGDGAMRTVILQGLDDTVPIVLPLQHAPLIQTRRFGPIGYRTYLVAKGDAKPREGEDAHGLQAVENAFMEADLATLTGTRDDLLKVQASTALIQTTSIERLGFEQAVRFERLSPLIEKMLAFVDGIVRKRDPSAASVTAAPDATTPDNSTLARVRNFLGAGGPRGAPAGQTSAESASSFASAVGSPEAAAGALAGAAAYFSRCEPSNPALLLVRQAEQLRGKSFFEVMRILMPAQAEQATINIGADKTFELPVERLSTLSADADTAGAMNGGSRAGNGDAADAQFTANTRLEALTLLHQVGEYYREVEPSSPIPLLTDRALALAEQDFLSLLKDVLPGGTGEAEASE